MSDFSIMDFYSDAVKNAREYADIQQVSIRNQLGAGYDGVVYATHSESVIKALRFEQLYLRERDVYLRLQEREIHSVKGFAVPQLINYDDDLWIVEMEIVSPPFVVDFASAGLDSRTAEFPEEVYEEWEREKQEQFGNNWPKVLEILSGFRRLGIYLADVKPGNIEFGQD